jgi:hypothetical protein
MRSNMRVLLMLAIVLILICAVTPVVAQQENSQNAPPSQPSQRPGDVRDGAPTEDQSWRNYESNDAETRNRNAGNARGAWAIPVVTLIAGVGIGYVLGRRQANKPALPGSTSDRAA